MASFEQNRFHVQLLERLSSSGAISHKWYSSCSPIQNPFDDWKEGTYHAKIETEVCMWSKLLAHYENLPKLNLTSLIIHFEVNLCD